MNKGPPYDDWDIRVFCYAERHAVAELLRVLADERRRPNDRNAAIVGHYKGVLHRIRLQVSDREEELNRS